MSTRKPYMGHHGWAGNPIHMRGSGFGQFRFDHRTRASSPSLNEMTA